MFDHLLLSERKRMFRFLNKLLHIQLGHLSIEARKHQYYTVRLDECVENGMEMTRS